MNVEPLLPYTVLSKYRRNKAQKKNNIQYSNPHYDLLFIPTSIYLGRAKVQVLFIICDKKEKLKIPKNRNGCVNTQPFHIK